jgi:hypothetical protein
MRKILCNFCEFEYQLAKIVTATVMYVCYE